MAGKRRRGRGWGLEGDDRRLAEREGTWADKDRAKNKLAG